MSDASGRRLLETQTARGELGAPPLRVLGRGGSFPSWGRRARIMAVRRDGSRTRVRRRRVAFRNVAYLHVRSRRAGYVVTARTLPTRLQSSLLTPPTLALRSRRAGTAVRRVPVNGGSMMFASRP